MPTASVPLSVARRSMIQPQFSTQRWNRSPPSRNRLLPSIPISSKYDAYLAGKATLTAQEARGLRLFEANDKGNCASCHISQRANDGEPPQFTDFGLIALGVPRNPAIPANADPKYFDLGLCGPLRADFLGRAEYCGLFRTPSLRNAALKQAFFHNGAFHTLRDAVAFYATRDTDPGRWYPKDATGAVQKFNDLPKQYQANINTDPPFGETPGGKPALADRRLTTSSPSSAR